MTLSNLIPNLDDRHFQDIVDEAKKRIPHYCDEWTDHNVSDPGVTFIELFAWMTDMILYRVNQVPDRHYVKFMETMGIKLKSAIPAHVPVTFWLSAPQEGVMTIPAGTEVSSTQTETETPIVFTTNEDFQVTPPLFTAVVSRVATEKANEKRIVTHNKRLLDMGASNIGIFSTVPQVDDALYLGFENDLSHHILSIRVDCETAGGAGVIPNLPPYLWEVSTGKGDMDWQTCEVELDTSLGLNVSGRIELHLPHMDRSRIQDQNLYWLRLRVRAIGPTERQAGMLPYEVTPRIKQIAVASLGGTTECTHAQVITHELLGRSSSEPNQRFFLKHKPVLEARPDERLAVEEHSKLVPWQEVQDFADSGPEDRHYLLDHTSGEVRFGPAIRLRNGDIKRHGHIPPRNATIVFTRYRTGGGLMGNIETGILNTLKTAIPYIDRVLNRRAARGGLDAESLNEAMMRMPLMLRSRDRAMTASDFEFLTRQAWPEKVGRVRCLQPQPSDANPSVLPGQVYVLVVPQVKHKHRYIPSAQLRLTAAEIGRLADYLDERRLLTTRVYVREPIYRWVSVRVSAGVTPGMSEAEVERMILERLYQFLNPLTGGLDGQGWPFGRDLFVADVYQALQGMEGILFIRNVELYTSSPNGRRVDQPVESGMIDVVEHGVIASGYHDVNFVR